MDFQQMKKGQPFEKRYHGFNKTSEINPKFYVKFDHTEPEVNESTMDMNFWLKKWLLDDVGVVLLIIAIIFCICCLSFKCRSHMKSKKKKVSWKKSEILSSYCKSKQTPSTGFDVITP